MTTIVRISAVIDAAPLSRFQKRVIAVCLLLGLAEGINALSIGYAIPSLSVQYGVDPAVFAVIFVAALVGEILGEFFLAPLGDRVGRRTMIRIGIAVFALAAIPSALATSVEALAAFRFFAGLGIGAAVPSVYALAGDYTPARAKGRVISILTMSISAGGVLIGLVASSFIPAFGGSWFLLLGGALPLVILLATWRTLPESVENLAERSRTGEVHNLMGRIDPTRRELAGIQYTSEEPHQGARLVSLFRNGRAWPTIVLWLMSFFGVFNAYFVFSFLATILIIAGTQDSTALLTTSMATFGGMAGAVALGFTMDRTRLGAAAGSIGSAIAILALLGLAGADATTNPAWVLGLGFALGIGAIGTNSCCMVISTQLYPSTIRATGFGWYSGVGRLGGLVAPVLVGALMGAHVAPAQLMQIVIIPNIIVGALLIVFALRWGTLLHGSAPVLDSTDPALTPLNLP